MKWDFHPIPIDRSMNTQPNNIIRNLKAQVGLFMFFLTIVAPSILFCQHTPGIRWQKCAGGNGGDGATSILQTSDGGFIVAGATASMDGDFSTNHGNNGLPGINGYDGFVMKIDSLGSLQWQKCLGGTGDDELDCIIQTSDGGYIAVGSTNSSDGDVSGQHGGFSGGGNTPALDAWVVKLDVLGNIEWQKCLGGMADDYARSIIQNYDTSKGYILAGFTYSTYGDVSGRRGGGPYNPDVWVVGLSSSGKITSQKCFGGTSDEYGFSIVL
jgi:hypothetical protein